MPSESILGRVKGCYAFFDNTGQCLYVGKASHIGSRLRQHTNWCAAERTSWIYRYMQSLGWSEEWVLDNIGYYRSRLGLSCEHHVPLGCIKSETHIDWSQVTFKAWIEKEIRYGDMETLLIQALKPAFNAVLL